MKYQSKRIYNNKVLFTKECDSFGQFLEKIERINQKKASIHNRQELLNLLLDLASSLKKNKEKFGLFISDEVGRCINECIAEIDKSIQLIEYYTSNSKLWLENKIIPTKASESFVAFEPLGNILAVMPWNYPVWQILRFAIPALCAGNGTIVKPAPGVARVTEELLKLFHPDIPFDIAWLHHDDIEKAIEHTDALAFTGSHRTGSYLASLAGKHLKKSVMELGGSNPFIVLADASLQNAAHDAAYSRFRDAGQSCNAAKRLIVVEEIFDEFLQLLKEEVSKYHPGDPRDKETTLASLHLENAVEDMEKFIQDALTHGAQLEMGGHKVSEHLFEATILSHVSNDALVSKEEVFGPILPVYKVKNHQEALVLANQSDFGLGASIYTQNIELAKQIAQQIQTGSVYINRHTSSDLSLPFGGVKKSGYGRELSSFGIYEFVNIKTYWQK